MQREYRGKRIDTGEWVYGYLIGENWIVGDVEDWTEEYICLEYWWKVIPETVGQSTGLKDKNCKEIYAGDILESILEEYDNLSEKVYVAWCEDGYWGVYTNPSHLLGMLRSYACGDYSIISTIHDNPELLQEVDNGFNR